VFSSQLGHCDSKREYSWFRSSNGQYKSSITNVSRGPPEVEVAVEVFVVSADDDEIEEFTDEELAREEVDEEEEEDKDVVEATEEVVETLVEAVKNEVDVVRTPVTVVDGVRSK
jgi:esterase/lipase